MYIMEAAFLAARSATSSTTSTEDPSVNIGPRGLGVIWMVVGLTLFVVCLRLYSQVRIIHHFGLSEYLMIGSVTIFTAFASLITVQYTYGWGHHQSTVAGSELLHFFKFNITTESFGVSGSTLGRMSFIAYLIHLFGLPSKKRLRHFLWFMFWMQLLTNGLTIVFIYVPCKDVRALYNTAIAAHTACWDASVQTYIGYAHTAWNGLTDLVMTAIPVALIWNLKMPVRVKMTVVVLLGMSGLAFVGVIMKIVYLNALSHRGDATYNTVPMFAWIAVETGLVDMAASAPALRPMFRGLLGDLSRPSGMSYELSTRHTGPGPTGDGTGTRDSRRRHLSGAESGSGVRNNMSNTFSKLRTPTATTTTAATDTSQMRESSHGSEEEILGLSQLADAKNEAGSLGSAHSVATSSGGLCPPKPAITAQEEFCENEKQHGTRGEVTNYADTGVTMPSSVTPWLKKKKRSIG